MENNQKANNNKDISNINNPSKKKQKMLMREKRNKQYEDIAKECANLNISEIRVEDFAEARKKELNKFVQILNSKYNSKGGFQLLPKHMRRRQMSHNPFRIPVRNRVSNLNVNIKSRCKKHKKKKR
jgi:hypothetical protein